MDNEKFIIEQRSKKDGIVYEVLDAVEITLRTYSIEKVKQTGQDHKIIDFIIGEALMKTALVFMCPQFGMTRERGIVLESEILKLIREAIRETT